MIESFVRILLLRGQLLHQLQCGGRRVGRTWIPRRRTTLCRRRGTTRGTKLFLQCQSYLTYPLQGL